MAQSEQITPSALQELLGNGKLAGSWTLDAARSEIGLKSKSMWGLVPVKGVFRQITGNGTLSPAGEVSGTISVVAFSFMVQEPSGIMARSSARSRSESLRM